MSDEKEVAEAVKEKEADKPVEVAQETAPSLQVKQCVILTDGNVVRLGHNSMNLLEMRSAFQMLLAHVDAEINRLAKPQAT
jgi:flagellar basal body rod protein FlgB